jgi:hypothetical protein
MKNVTITLVEPERPEKRALAADLLERVAASRAFMLSE